MIFGFVLTSLSYSLADGSYQQIISLFTQTKTGHAQVLKLGYLDRPSLYKTIYNSSNLMTEIEKDPEVKATIPRIESGALAFYQSKSMGVQIRGVDPKKEKNAIDFEKKLTYGHYFTSGYEVLISEQLARRLGVSVGQDLILISQGADGSVANDLFRVIGLFDAEALGEPTEQVLIPITAVQEFLSLQNRIHKILVLFHDPSLSQVMSKKLNNQLESYNLEVLPWQVVEKAFYTAMQADLKGNVVTLSIIIFMVAMGVLNTVLMSVMERTREWGVLKTLGTQPKQIFWLIILESSFLAIFSGMVGLLISYLVNSYFAKYGIHLDHAFEYGGIAFTEMVGIVNLKVFLLPFVVIVLSAVGVSLIPALRAAQITPIKALHAR